MGNFVQDMRPVAYVVDDDDTVRELLSGLIESIRAEVRSFRSGKEFLAAYTPAPRQCVVSDMRMPEISGLRLLNDLKERFRPPPPVIFVTAYADVTTAIEAMKEGAFDYVIKPVQGDPFLDKVQAAFAKSQELHALRLAQSAHDARLALLTPKEKEVLQLILRGGSTKDIAETLQGSTRTVEHHRARIMSKLHVNSLVELMALFITDNKH